MEPPNEKIFNKYTKARTKHYFNKLQHQLQPHQLHQYIELQLKKLQQKLKKNVQLHQQCTATSTNSDKTTPTQTSIQTSTT